MSDGRSDETLEQRRERRLRERQKKQGDKSRMNLLPKNLQQKTLWATPAEEAIILARYRELVIDPTQMPVNVRSITKVLAAEFQRDERTIKKAIERERAREKEHAKVSMLVQIKQGLGVDYNSIASQALEVLLTAVYKLEDPNPAQRWAASKIMDGIDRAAGRKVGDDTSEIKDDDIPT